MCTAMLLPESSNLATSINSEVPIIILLICRFYFDDLEEMGFGDFLNVKKKKVANCSANCLTVLTREKHVLLLESGAVLEHLNNE